MPGLVFEDHQPPSDVVPFRADVACFVGTVARRGEVLPHDVAAWLAARGWGRALVPPGPPVRGRASTLAVDAGLPLPVDSWESFDRLFAWDERPLDDHGARGATWLGAAVRAFFDRGGRTAIIVPCGDPWVFRADDPSVRGADWLAARQDALLPGLGQGGPSPTDRSTWRGLGHLLGLEEVSLLVLPDLPDLFAARVDPPPGDPIPPPEFDEIFVPCAPDDDPEAASVVRARESIPRLGGVRLAAWRRFVVEVLAFLKRRAPEVHLVASLPLLRPGTLVHGDLHATLVYDGGPELPVDADDDGPPCGPPVLARHDGSSGSGVASAWLQLAWPWLATPRAVDLPGGVEPPDGTLAGLLAANALEQGTFRSAVGWSVGPILDLVPFPDRATLASRQPVTAGSGTPIALEERITLLAPTPTGVRLRTDVDTSADPAWRPGGVSRLMSSVRRAARLVGTDVVFDGNDPRTWARLRQRIEATLRAFRAEGALAGATEADAFTVRCDRSTMTGQDLDQGRLVAEVAFRPAFPIDTIRVELTVAGGTSATRLGEVA